MSDVLLFTSELLDPPSPSLEELLELLQAGVGGVGLCAVVLSSGCSTVPRSSLFLQMFEVTDTCPPPGTGTSCDGRSLRWVGVDCLHCEPSKPPPERADPPPPPCCPKPERDRSCRTPHNPPTLPSGRFHEPDSVANIWPPPEPPASSSTHRVGVRKKQKSPFIC